MPKVLNGILSLHMLQFCRFFFYFLKPCVCSNDLLREELAVCLNKLDPMDSLQINMLIKKQRGWGVFSYSVLNACFATLSRCQENMKAELMFVFLYDIIRNMAVNHKITHRGQRNETKAPKLLYLPKCNLKPTHVGSHQKYFQHSGIDLKCSLQT